MSPEEQRLREELCTVGASLFARGYFWLVVLLTPTALLALSAVDDQGVEVAVQRVGWTALGIALGPPSQSCSGGSRRTSRVPLPPDKERVRGSRG